MKKNKPKKVQMYIYMFLLLALSGNPFFSYGDMFYQLVFSGFVAILIINHISYFNFKNSKIFFLYILFFCGIFFGQKTFLGFVSFYGALGFLLKITFGYIVIKFVGSRFKIIYFKLLYFLSLISLFGYLFNFLGFNIPNLLNDNSKLKSIIFFTQQSEGLRNSGMFWEPGAFAAYICLGFFLYLGNIKELLRNHRFRLVIILVALITTFSTTGYFVLFLIIFLTLFLEYSKKNKILILPTLIGVFILGQFTYNSNDFLNGKVESQFENSINKDADEFSPDRFGAFLFDLHYIKKHPLIGNGFHQSTRYADHPWLQNKSLGHGNGFSNFLASMGILSFLFYSFFIVKYKTQKPLVFLFLVIVLLQGEQLLNFPLFLSLPFIFIYEYKHSSSFNLS